MNIGFFTDSYFPGIDGVTYTIQAWRDRLESRGHEVYVVYPESGHEPDDHEIPVPSLPNPFYRQYRFPTYRRLSTLPDLDVVHCHGPASTARPRCTPTTPPSRTTSSRGSSRSGSPPSPGGRTSPTRTGS